jgi:hypothetical protein
MLTLEINTNGAWRSVISGVEPKALPEVKRACVAITNASVKAGQSRAYGVTWRLRDAAEVKESLAFSTGEDGKPNTAWKPR